MNMAEPSSETTKKELSSRLATGYGWAVVFATLLIFGRVVFLPLVMWDDPIYIMFNPLVTDWASAPWFDKIFTPSLGYPLGVPIALYALLGGVDGVFSIHLLSVVAHSANACLVYSLFNRSLVNQRVACVGAMVWALHPLVVESVAWATNLKELLVTFMILAALRLVDSEMKPAPRLAILAMLCLLGALSKPTIVVLPVILFLYSSLRGKLKERRSDVVVSALNSVLVLAVSVQLHSDLVNESSFLTRNWSVTIFNAIGAQARNYFWPFDLNPYYPYQLSEWTGLTFRGLGLTLALIGVGAWLFKSKKWVPLFGLGFLVVCYLPYSNLLPLPRFTADTYAYLPSVGLVLMLVSLHGQWNRRNFGVAAITISILSIVTFTQIDRWRSTEALMTPLLGQPQVLSLPYQLIAFEKFLLGDNEKAAELLVDAWPYLSSEMPRFAAQVFLNVGDVERAHQAMDAWASSQNTQAARDFAGAVKAEHALSQ
jgi:hypothetical protein